MPLVTRFAVLLAAACLLVTAMLHAEEPFPEIRNTQKEGEHPPTPAESVAAIELPEGFRATLFAGEPDVHQPIGFDIDDRGRLWVVECFTYAERGYADKFRDRVIILEDTDNDGTHDNRKVFWNGGDITTSIAIASGGAWLLDKGRLIFLADANGDDTPDGEPEVLLDGFDHDSVGHNIASGLMWGPDGWLYGRHGIQATSLVGAPGTRPENRVALNCSIWRYHPERKVFEVVCHGTTNPWGLDYNEHGQFFMTNNVIGHLWHIVPGAHYHRMYGEDFNPYVYGLIDQTADHYHWDKKGTWSASRDGVANDLGGGHSHCGGMIYLGDNWPDEYRGHIFMCNTHGRRVNMDILERQGNSYVGKHGKDFMLAGQQWFRGVELKYGPDGGVYVTDWSDLGECHDHDGVHRTSGRIYKITYGDPQPHPLKDTKLAELSDGELVDLLGHRNEWFARRALRILKERATAERDMTTAREKLVETVNDPRQEVPRRLRALWALNATGSVPREVLVHAINDENEHLRVWAIKLMVDSQPADEAGVTLLANLAANDASGLVRLTLASALQRLTPEQSWPIAEALARHKEDAYDRVQPLMLWYGLEPIVTQNPDRALQLMASTPFGLVRMFIARRLTSELNEQPDAIAKLVEVLPNLNTAQQREILTGMTAALRGWRKAAAPANWSAVSEALASSTEPDIKNLARELSVVFGDGRAADQLLALARDNNQSAIQRGDALLILIENKTPGLEDLLTKLISDRSTLSTIAIRGLSSYDIPDVGGKLVNAYRRLSPEAKRAAIETMSARAESAVKLLEAVGGGRIDRQDVTAADARQLMALNNERVTELLEKHWGSIRQTPSERREKIEEALAHYTPDRLSEADRTSGQALYKKICGNCHKLYGEGGEIGPDLTGSGRTNMTYLLENILDPSAAVAKEFRTSNVLLVDGRLLTGVVLKETDQTITLQTPERQVVLDREEIDEIVATSQSLMPEGLMTPLSDEQIRDLLAYLQHVR